jgi:hypothetical protein
MCAGLHTSSLINGHRVPPEQADGGDVDGASRE